MLRAALPKTERQRPSLPFGTGSGARLLLEAPATSSLACKLQRQASGDLDGKDVDGESLGDVDGLAEGDAEGDLEGKVVPLFGFFISCSSQKVIDSAEEEWRPEQICPGDAGCESRGDGILLAGASALPITPTCFEDWEDLNDDRSYRGSQDSFLDCGCDQLQLRSSHWSDGAQGSVRFG